MTEEQVRQYHQRVDENIRTYGYHTTFIFSDKSPSFCYSTGIYKSFGIPEIFISSLPQNLSSTLMANYVDKFVPEIKLTDYVLSTIRFYNGNSYKYVQLIYPDTAGHFPNDPGYDYDQVIMGQFVN